MRNYLISILTLVVISFQVQSQTIVINEFMATNNAYMTDEFGEYEDWIEIYNYGSSSVDIAGLFITDDFFTPLTWQIPFGNDSTIIAPGEYLILWADNDTEQGVLHVDIKLNGGGEQIALFNASGNPVDTVSFSDQIPNVSYGRFPDNSNTWVHFAQATPGETNASFYLTSTIYNYSFSPANGQSVDIDILSNETWSLVNSESWLSVNPTSGTNNGNFTVNITSENNSGADRYATIILSGVNVTDQEIAITQFANSGLPTIKINELMAENDNSLVDEMGEYDDWIELFNYGSIAVDVGGMYISDDLGDPLKFQIPIDNSSETTINPGGYLLLWADNDTEQGTLHTNFKLSNNGEEIGLFLNQLTAVDSVIYPIQYTDISYGRAWDGVNAWTYFIASTPLASNANAIEENEEKEVNIYPNPTSGFITIEAPAHKSNLLLYALNGGLIKSIDLHNKKEVVCIEELPSGIYLLKLISDQEIYHQRIVKN